MIRMILSSYGSMQLPTYTFHNNVTLEEFTTFMSISDRDIFLTENPNMSQSLAAPGYGDSVRLGVHKIDKGFNDVLHKIKGAHFRSNINTL